MTVPRTGSLVVLSGPSGVGKDTVLRRLREVSPELRYSVSFTTRSPRPGEVDGVAYSFVDEAAFGALAARGDFLEWAEVHGRRYGTSIARVAEAVRNGTDILLKIDVQGAARLRERLADPEVRRALGAAGALFVFLLPPSVEELRRRLADRDTDAPAAVDRRLERAAAELAAARTYDHTIVNDDVEHAVAQLQGIIAAWRRSRAAGPVADAMPVDRSG